MKGADSSLLSKSKKRLTKYLRKAKTIFGLCRYLMKRQGSPSLPTNLLESYFYDMDLYYSYATFHDKPHSLENIEAQIMALGHSLEKRLSTKGRDIKRLPSNFPYLLHLLKKYKQANPDHCHVFVKATLDTLELCLDEVRPFHSEDAVVKELGELVRDWKEKEIGLGGVKEWTRDELIKKARGDFSELANSRFSIRDFSEKEVDLELIKEAIKLAQRSPSVCNRQAAKVYLFSDRKEIQEILKLQNGSAGFAHKVQRLLVVTADLRSFNVAKERNQAFIDGALFAMSLLYGLQYQGLGACSLNWSVEWELDKTMHELTRIPEHDRILFFIAAGHLPEKLSIPASVRKDIDQVLIQN